MLLEIMSDIRDPLDARETAAARERRTVLEQRTGALQTALGDLRREIEVHLRSEDYGAAASVKQVVHTELLPLLG